jgi:RNA polymerase sigma-70 factor, ECF subfamily
MSIRNSITYNSEGYRAKAQPGRTICLTRCRGCLRGGGVNGPPCADRSTLNNFVLCLIGTEDYASGIPDFERANRLGRSMNVRLQSEEETNEPSDTELLRRMAAGDTSAFTNFYDRCSTLLFSVAMRIVNDVHEAEDILQDSALVIWEKAPLYNSAFGRPLSWAVVITRNKAIDRLRFLRRNSEAITRIAKETVIDFPTYGAEKPGGAISSETGRLLRETLISLPVDQRLAIELAFFCGLSQSEIATKLGQPLGTIKARIRRGMRAMREILEEQL